MRLGPLAGGRFALVAFAAIAVAHLGVELAFLGGSFAGTGEIGAFIAFATGVSLLATAFAVAATAATSTTASTTPTTVATGSSVLRRAITALEVGRRRLGRAGVLDGGCCARRDGGIGVGSRLLLTLAFPLALTLCLALRVALRVAFTRRLVTLCFALRLRFARCVALRVARRGAGVTIAAMFAVTVTTAAFLVAASSCVLVAIALTMRAAIAIASTVAITAVPGAATVAIAVSVAMTIPVAVTTRFAACRGRLGGLGGGSRTGE